MDIRDYFKFEPTASRLEDLETPVPVIDISKVERNARRWQERCDARGIANRPHIKTHKLVGLARYQSDIGAKGITVQKLGEAEVMAGAGLTDMLLTFNVVGRSKLERLAALAGTTRISVVADSIEIAEGLAAAGRAAGRDIVVLVECDTGAGRNGVQTPADAVALARRIAAMKGIAYGGLMTYPRTGARLQAEAFFEEALALAKASGLETPMVSTGGSPEMWSDVGLRHVTEYRAGTYIYYDRMQEACGACSFDDCALTVLATVVSRPTHQRAIIDAGSKALTSDLGGLSGFGIVREFGMAPIYALKEEHGYLDVSASPHQPKVGEMVRIVPNHVCPVSNLYDRVVFVDGDRVLGAVKVDARGMVQ
jgi:D-serine deaminase-like pyridoxal phosphate-dependent protein